MNSGDLNKQLDALKRQAMDLVHELHARKLAIPAGALLVAIVAAMVLLPHGSTPPPAPPTTATTPVVKPAIARVAQISLIKPSTLSEDIPLSGSEDPFTGHSGYKCVKISSNPKMYNCMVSNLLIRIVCVGEGGTGPCAEGAGATPATSGSGTETTTGGSGTEVTPIPPVDGGGGDGGDGGGNSGGGGTNSSSYYVVTVSIDGKTIKNVVAGDELPNQSAPLAIYAGTNDGHDKGVFIAADGVVVTGVAVDETFSSFSLRTGETATLTDANGAAHKMTLKSISKVKK
jgi:hypothetical protein